MQHPTTPHRAHARRHRANSPARAVLAAMGLLAAAAAPLATGCGGIVETVEDERVYRSGQLDPDDLRAEVESRGIRTVINLRGENLEKEWYRDEVRVLADMDVAHESVRLSSRRYPRPKEVLAVLDTFERAEYPILVHCLGGADRTGLACAIYQVEHGATVERANDALALRYGHLGWMSGRSELGDFLDLYRDTGERHGKTLRQWIEEDYERVLKERLGQSEE